MAESDDATMYASLLKALGAERDALKLQNDELKARLWDIVQAFKRGTPIGHAFCECEKCKYLYEAVRSVRVYGPDSEIFTEKLVEQAPKKCPACGYSAHSGRCGEQDGSGPEDSYV